MFSRIFPILTAGIPVVIRSKRIDILDLRSPPGERNPLHRDSMDVDTAQGAVKHIRI